MIRIPTGIQNLAHIFPVLCVKLNIFSKNFGIRIKHDKYPVCFKSGFKCDSKFVLGI